MTFVLGKLGHLGLTSLRIQERNQQSIRIYRCDNYSDAGAGLFGLRQQRGSLDVGVHLKPIVWNAETRSSPTRLAL